MILLFRTVIVNEAARPYTRVIAPKQALPPAVTQQEGELCSVIFGKLRKRIDGLLYGK